MVAPFDGLRVVDLSTRLSGAFAARLFGDFGADVLLAEPPEGHPLRHEPPFLDDRPGPYRSAVHAYFNWNKHSVCVDSEAALADVLRGADVVVTTTTSPTQGLADALAALPPQTVHLSITAHGLDDPLTAVPGNNLTMGARVGWASINRFADEAPLQLPRDSSGVVGGVTGFIAAAAALRRCDATDHAERVDVSELEALALTVHPWGVASVYHGADGRRRGGGRRRGDPGPLWDMADGRMNLGLADFHNWREAMNVCNLPEIGARPDLIPDIGRHSQDMRDVVWGLAESLPKLKRWDVFHELAKLRCVIGVVQDVEDMPANEQFAARDYFVTTEVEGRPARASGAPAKLSPSPWKLRRPAPRLGEAALPSKPVRADAPPIKTPPANDLAAGPLAGIRVLSFGQAWSGTFGTELFALLGADVVQIASTKHPDSFRRISNRVPAGVADESRRQHPANTQGQYNAVNLHKREINLDLTHERGREILWKLLPRFDIVADNFRPTVLPSWGITLERLHEIRPGMIWASISGYGEDGPYRDYPANGNTTEPMAGLASLNGYEGDPGMNTNGLVPDPVSGYFLCATVLAALAHRDRTGEAQRVDLSMMESVATTVGDALVAYDITGRKPGPRGNHHPRIAPHNTFRAAGDDHLALAAETEEAWAALKTIVGDSRLGTEPFSTNARRKANEAELDEILAAWCLRQDAETTAETLGAAGVCAARVVPLAEVYSRPHPHLAESGFITRIDHPEAGPTWLPGRPWRFSAAVSEPIRGAPCVGQHSREVFAEELGMTDTEYDHLLAARVTGTLDEIQSRA